MLRKTIIQQEHNILSYKFYIKYKQTFFKQVARKGSPDQVHYSQGAKSEMEDMNVLIWHKSATDQRRKNTSIFPVKQKKMFRSLERGLSG